MSGSIAPINMALYRLLVKQGADEATAEEAARIDTSVLATKQDLAQGLAELKAEIIKTVVLANVATLIALAGLVATIVRMLS